MSKQSRKRRHCCKFGGRRGWWMGKKNEEKFYCSFHLESFEKPRWLKKIRKGTPDEDRRGIDFVVETHTNPPLVFIQIKSSEAGRKKFWKQHSPNGFDFPILVIVLSRHANNYNKVRRLFFETIKNCLGLS